MHAGTHLVTGLKTPDYTAHTGIKKAAPFGTAF